VQQGTVQVAGRWFSTPEADTIGSRRRFLTERPEKVNRAVQEEQVPPPSASPTIAARQQLPSSNNNGSAVPAAAATPTPKEPPPGAADIIVSKAPTSPPSLVPTISAVPTTATPTVIRMDLLALRLGLVKVEGGGGSPDRRRILRRRRQQKQPPPWGLRLLQNESGTDDDDHPYEAAVVLDALNEFLCKDATIVAVRDACPNPAKPLQVASAHEEDSATHLVSHEPVVTVEPAVPSFNVTTTTTTLRASQWTVQYPIVIAYGLGGYDDAAIEVFQDRVQALLNRKMDNNSSRLYRQIYNATGGYRPAIVAPNVTHWVDPYYTDDGGNSTGNGTLPPGSNNNTNSDDASSGPPPYDPSRLEPLRLAGIFLLMLTLDAYAVLLWLARRRRRRKVILEHQEQHDRDDADETVGFITVPNAAAAATTTANEAGEGPDINLSPSPASPPALLVSPTFEGVSTSSSSTSSDANKPQLETHEAPKEPAALSSDEARQLAEPTSDASGGGQLISEGQGMCGSRAEPTSEPKENDLPPTKMKLLWFT
jgi:hypothetical protein